MSSDYSALVGKIRGKFPGMYDDMSDEALGKAVIAKHPEYQDLVKPIAPNGGWCARYSSPRQTPRLKGFQ